MELRDVLLLLMSGGGGAIVYFLMDNVAVLKNLRPDHKRYVSWLLSGVLPVAAWGAMLAMGYEPMPATWQAAIEKVFALVFVAFSTAQGLHGAIDLKRQYKMGLSPE